MSKSSYSKLKPCIVGLGYVGLPLLINLSKKYQSIGYDINKKRVNDLKKGKDIFGEIKKKDLNQKKINFTFDLKLLKKCNLFIITVPTPILFNKNPDLNAIKDICLELSKIIKKNDIIIFESTVYPGVTNDICIPLLQKKNKLLEGRDFFVGYSPERVNPGDKKYTLKNINKILAYPHEFLKKDLKILYSNLCKKIILSNNIREAETAKVIENIQRDVNIGLINEIFLVCNKLKIDFKNVIELASTKWNFIKFKPGLVGGHCLPVDPYYFSYISAKNNLKTRITLAGRYINDSMVKFTVNKIYKLLLEIENIKKKKILVCGLSYKKDVADLRNSLAFEVLKKLIKKNLKIMGYDPLISRNNLDSKMLVYNQKNIKKFDVFVILTNHSILRKNLANLKNKYFISPL